MRSSYKHNYHHCHYYYYYYYYYNHYCYSYYYYHNNCHYEEKAGNVIESERETDRRALSAHHPLTEEEEEEEGRGVARTAGRAMHQNGHRRGTEDNEAHQLTFLAQPPSLPRPRACGSVGAGLGRAEGRWGGVLMVETPPPQYGTRAPVVW